MVRETVESLRAQTFGDFRAVVSDNGSEPAQAASVREFVSSLGDPRITFFQQPRNDGEYGQGRYFLKEAGSAEFFLILHDDDLLEPSYLSRAVDALTARPVLSVYVANPLLIDENGAVSETLTAHYLRDHGRTETPEGTYPVQEKHFAAGFTPISGTVFRTEHLRASGYVDDDCFGSFPFEFNIMVRLGDYGAKGWFDPRPGLRVRYHAGQLRNTLGLMSNSQVVGTMRKILEKRRYDGFVERRRRQILCRLHRAEAVMALKAGDRHAARRSIGAACAVYAASPKAWGLRARLYLPWGA